MSAKTGTSDAAVDGTSANLLSTLIEKSDEGVVRLTIVDQAVPAEVLCFTGRIVSYDEDGTMRERLVRLAVGQSDGNMIEVGGKPYKVGELDEPHLRMSEVCFRCSYHTGGVLGYIMCDSCTSTFGVTTADSGKLCDVYDDASLGLVIDGVAIVAAMPDTGCKWHVDRVASSRVPPSLALYALVLGDESVQAAAQRYNSREGHTIVTCQGLPVPAEFSPRTKMVTPFSTEHLQDATAEDQEYTTSVINSKHNATGPSNLPNWRDPDSLHDLCLEAKAALTSEPPKDEMPEFYEVSLQLDMVYFVGKYVRKGKTIDPSRLCQLVEDILLVYTVYNWFSAEHMLPAVLKALGANYPCAKSYGVVEAARKCLTVEGDKCYFRRGSAPTVSHAVVSSKTRLDWTMDMPDDDDTDMPPQDEPIPAQTHQTPAESKKDEFFRSLKCLKDDMLSNEGAIFQPDEAGSVFLNLAIKCEYDMWITTDMLSRIIDMLCDSHGLTYISPAHLNKFLRDVYYVLLKDLCSRFARAPMAGEVGVVTALFADLLKAARFKTWSTIEDRPGSLTIARDLAGDRKLDWKVRYMITETIAQDRKDVDKARTAPVSIAPVSAPTSAPASAPNPSPKPQGWAAGDHPKGTVSSQRPRFKINDLDFPHLKVEPVVQRKAKRARKSANPFQSLSTQDGTGQ